MLGMPMPEPITETGTPLYVPVKPNIPLTLLNCFGFSRKFSAINFARNGSPGISTVFAMSPTLAVLCGVPLNSAIIKFLSKIN